MGKLLIESKNFYVNGAAVQKILISKKSLTNHAFRMKFAEG